ncbi:hypothetical protein [Asanoa siamensis]|uniref:Uncharacterized protein n=1 Tax=Asanoa siamensis TaxID=926357 RepID=A0ABQ4CL55_9ACTN|nr:hypothetical protein [Asanoa siamensis]GIF71708.1 hypothetical protein Asi02nite_12260 [Asanoa siamensis]
MVEDGLPRGETFEDLAAFLREPEPGGYPIQEVRECVCRSCGGRSFEVVVAADEGAVRRTCLACGAHDFIGDSDEYWDDAEEHGVCECPCGNETFAAAVGYSLREDGEDVRWLYVALRCLSCGGMGVYEDWKISYGPSLHLLDQA